MCNGCVLDVPVQEVYEKIVLPDVYQLEHGVHFVGSGNFIGTIHFIAGDHEEIVALAGITCMISP